MKRTITALLCAVILGTACPAYTEVQRPPSPSLELNTLLMHATFFVVGRSKVDGMKQSFGTIFAMALPKKDKPAEGTLVLVTAAHLLNDIEGDEAIGVWRRKKPTGSIEACQCKSGIRKKNV